MDCKIIEEIKNSKVKSWKNVNHVENKELLVCWSGPYTSHIYDKDQIITTKKLVNDLEEFYKEQENDYGNFLACYKTEQIVLCLRASKSTSKWDKVKYTMHETYPVIPKGDIFRNGEKVGTVENYSQIEHVGKVTLDEYGPECSEYGVVGEDQIVKVSGKDIERPGYVFQGGIWQWIQNVKGSERRFDDTSTVEELDISLLNENMDAAISLGKFEDVKLIAIRIINEKNGKDMDAVHHAFTKLILTEMLLKDEIVFDHFEEAFRTFPHDEDLTILVVKLFQKAASHSKWAPFLMKLIDGELLEESKFVSLVKESDALNPTDPLFNSWND